MRDLFIVIISGLSGSGKSCTIKVFEDLGFYCVDNLPSMLVPTFVQLCVQSGEQISKVALGIDIRERDFLGNFISVFKQLKNEGIRVEMMFLEARDEVIVRRFSETRRPHPLARGKPVLEGIQVERAILKDLRKLADRIIDTSEYSVHQLKDLISNYYIDSGEVKKLHITLISFGYKYGIPYESDLIFDLRFLQNPNFVPDIRPLTGNDSRVVEYIMKFSESKTFYEYLKNFIDFLLPHYEREGRSYLNIGMGCTGGRHRSVAMINQFGDYLQKKGYNVTIRHRDILQ